MYRIEDPKLRIPKHLIRRFAGSDDYDTAVKELAGAGFWRDRGDTWEIVHHGDVIRQGLQAQRQKRDRDKRAQAARRKRVSATPDPPDISGDVSADVSAGVSHRVIGDTDRQSETFPSAPQNTHRRTL